MRLYGLLRLSNRHLLLCCKAEYRNLSFAVVAVSDEQHLSEDIDSALFEHEQVWNLVEARIANSTGGSINSTYMCSRPSEFADDEHAPVYILLNICRVIQLSTWSLQAVNVQYKALSCDWYKWAGSVSDSHSLQDRWSLTNSTGKSINSTYTCSGLKWRELICFTWNRMKESMRQLL